MLPAWLVILAVIFVLALVAGVIYIARDPDNRVTAFQPEQIEDMENAQHRFRPRRRPPRNPR